MSKLTAEQNEQINWFLKAFMGMKSDTEISKPGTFNTLELMMPKVNELLKQSRELETLRAENEALKAENEHLKSVMLKQPMNFELDAKDAQIKVLVEALSTIPAEALEKWKLERELIEMAKITDEADYESCKRLAKAILQLHHFNANRKNVKNAKPQQ